MNFLGWTTEKVEKLLRSIYGGKFNTKNLPPELYDATLAKLIEAVVSGFGDFSSPEFEAPLALLTDSVSVFSAAKTYQQLKTMEGLLTDGSGSKAKFSDFKKQADKVFETYNNSYLKTEFNTAFARSQSARQWEEIEQQKRVFPLLKYSTVGDERVRGDHILLDEIIRPVNDPFWDKFFPPNGWNCRCIVEQLEESDGEVTNLTKKKPPKAVPLFSSNPAKTGIIFDEKVHPYFKVSKRYSIAPRTKDGKVQKIKI